MAFTKFRQLKISYPTDAPKPDDQTITNIIKSVANVHFLTPAILKKIVDYFGDTIELKYNYGTKMHEFQCFSWTSVSV